MQDFKRYESARENLRRTIAPVEEYIEAAENEIYELRLRIETLEKLRPHWAQGFTSDSEAAQASTAALSQIWELLGVKNQTEAMKKLRAWAFVCEEGRAA